ncbi:MAG: PQQ-dependent sugar dehydrogenase, partial [Acidobacteria bacterium]|nr:PQQ-dependent sugar dehydrogenase [Acidobacteriota bacterium]
MKYLLMFGWVGVLWGQPTFVDPHYTADLVYAGDGMTAIDFASTGQLLAIEKKGRVLIFQPNGSGGFFAPTVFADLTSQVNWSGEAGLLGLAVDPDFASTRHVFLFYSTDDDQRITRLTSNPGFTAMEPGSELVLLSGLPRTANFHKAGELRFHPLDPETLFCSTGDDGEGIGTSGGIPLVQHPDFYHGKILRISKDNGQGVSSNPFWDGDPTSIRSRVWAVGFRNPFRFTFYPGAPIPDLLYSSENGDSTDRCSWVLMGSNGAWSASGDSGGFLNPPDPNHHVMQTLPRSVLGIAIADSGPFAPGGPTLYWANWLSGIRRYHLTGANLDTLTAIPEDSGQVFTDDIVGTDLEFGPDGNLYAAWSNGDDSTGGFFTIRRIRFSGVDPPVAAFSTTPNPATGPAPLMVSFTDSSSAPGSNIASRLWDFGDGASSSATNPSHTYTEPGIYTARLTVTNDEGLVDSVSQTVTAYRTVTVTLGGTVFDARTLPASPLASANELR